MIDWDTLTRVGQNDENARQIKMAECLSPLVIPVDAFQCIYVSSKETENKSRIEASQIISEFKQWSEDKMARFSEEEIEKYMDCLEKTGVIERDITGSYCLSEYLSYR